MNEEKLQELVKTLALIGYQIKKLDYKSYNADGEEEVEVTLIYRPGKKKSD